MASNLRAGRMFLNDYHLGKLMMEDGLNLCVAIETSCFTVWTCRVHTNLFGPRETKPPRLSESPLRRSVGMLAGMPA